MAPRAASSCRRDQKKFMFLAPLTDVVVQSAMLKDMQAKGIKRIAILNSDVAFGTSGRDSLEKAAADYGITIVAKETFGNADTDMTPQLTKIRGYRRRGDGPLGDRARARDREQEPPRARHQDAALPRALGERLQLPAPRRRCGERRAAPVVEDLRHRLAARLRSAEEGGGEVRRATTSRSTASRRPRSRATVTTRR